MTNKQKLIVLVGLHGAGKSEYAKNLIKSNSNYVIVSSNRIRTDNLEYNGKMTEPVKVFEELRKRVIKSLKAGKTVIVDATNLRIKERQKYIVIANELNIPVECKVILRTIDHCIDNSGNKEGVLTGIGSFQIPLEEEGFWSIDFLWQDETETISDKDNIIANLANALMTIEYKGMNLRSLSEAISTLAERSYPEDKIFIKASYLILIGKLITADSNYSQIGAYALLCYIMHFGVFSSLWYEICVYVNFFSSTWVWSDRLTKLLGEERTKKLMTLKDLFISIRTTDDIKQIIWSATNGNRN